MKTMTPMISPKQPHTQGAWDYAYTLDNFGQPHVQIAKSEVSMLNKSTF